MKKLLLRLLLGCVFCTIVTSAYAQDARVKASGEVKDDQGKPLSGASVSEQGLASNGTTTDAEGHFSLLLKGTSNTVTVSNIGYVRKTVKVNGQPITIILQTDDHTLNELVVVGYQSQKKRDITSAISTLSGKDIANIPESSFDQMLQGRLPGVSVLSSTGELGAAPAIVIRGSTNIDFGNANHGNTGPLYIIDGVIFDTNQIGTSYSNNNPLSFINPNDISSIEVLKDASASAIYGSKGGNGVIIVTTKQAKRGKPQVDISAFTGVTTAPNFLKVTTGNAERALKLDMLEQQLPYNVIETGQIPLALTDSLNSFFNSDVDWQGLLVRKNAVVNSQDVSIAAYSGNTSYRLSFNHYNEQGIEKGYGLEKLTPHLNLKIHPIKGLDITTDILLSSEVQSHGIGGSASQLLNTYNFPSSLIQLSPTQIATYSGQGNLYDDDKQFTIQGSIQVTDTINRNLNFHATFGANNYIDNYNYFVPSSVNGSLSTAYSQNNKNPGLSFEPYFLYDKVVGKNHFTGVLGGGLYSNETYDDNVSAAGINLSNVYTAETVPPGTNLNANSDYFRQTKVSYYARFNYDYDGKYLFMVSARRDASSIYSTQYQWGTFPAASAGWIASDEDFFKPLKNVISFLKFRASYGVTGNNPGQDYVKYQALTTDASYYSSTNGSLDQSSILGGIPSTYNGTTVISPFSYGNNYLNAGTKASNSVRWEHDAQADIGGDMELFNNRVSVTVDWYQKNSNNIFFYQAPAQATSGYQYFSGNFVSLRNQGFEFSTNIDVLGPKSPLKWNFNFNISYNSNIVTSLPNGGRDLLFDAPWEYKTLTVGEPIFSYRVYKTTGVYTSNAQVPTDPITGQKETFYGTPLQAGDPKYVDMNGDYNIDNDDKVDDGNPNPTYTGGFGSTFNYKRFSLSFFCSYVFGRKILNGALSDELNGSKSFQAFGTNAGPAAFAGLINQFYPAEGAKYARLVYPTYSGTDPWNIGTDYFVESGNFVKLKNVTLGYDLPDATVRKIGLKRLNIYVMADNLAMWKAAKDVADPELVDPTTGSDNTVYPTAVKFTLGVNIEL